MKKINKINLPIINKGKTNEEQENNKNISKILIIIIIFLIAILVLFSGYSMAKVLHEVIINGNAQIAEPILVVENNPSIDITALNNYGEYIFKVKNYDEQNKISEVDLKYYIEILSNVDDSINIELYEGEQKIQLNNNRTEYIQISKGQKQEKQYKIVVTYDKNKSNSMTDILEKIQVKVHTEQVKA